MKVELQEGLMEDVVDIITGIRGNHCTSIAVIRTHFQALKGKFS